MASNKDKTNVEVTDEAHTILAIVKACNKDVKTMSDAIIHLSKNQKK